MVYILDLNDNAPQFTKNGFTSFVKETADINDVILRVGALDRDAGENAVLRFSIISGNSDGYFDIDPTTGDIFVNRSLDLEGSAPPLLDYSLGKARFEKIYQKKMTYLFKLYPKRLFCDCTPQVYSVHYQRNIVVNRQLQKGYLHLNFSSFSLMEVTINLVILMSVF